MVNSKIQTFRNENDTGIHRLNVSTIINVNNFHGQGDVIFEVKHLNGATRYTTVDEAVTMGILVPVAGSSVTPNLAVLDEGTLVNDQVCEINFVGADVLAKQDTTNECRVDVYIPTPAYPSHYNTTDGNTNGFVNSVGTTNRYIAKPTTEGRGDSQAGTYNTNGWASRTTAHPVLRDNTIIYQNTADILLDDENTTLLIEAIDTDGSVIDSYTLTPINGNGTSSNVSNSISVNVSNYGPASDKFKARFRVTFDLTKIIPYSGRIVLRITHTSGGNDYIKEQEFFYDSQSNTANISGVSFSESTSLILKYLSGVKYYDYNSPFKIDITDIDYLNGDTYPKDQVRIEASEVGVPTLLLHDNTTGHDLSNWTNDWNDDNDEYHNNDWKITAHDYCYIGDARATATAIDWGDVMSSQSSNYPVLVNTWGVESDELSEYFIDEEYRKKSDWTDWDSTQDLSTYDGGDTGVQTICGKIKVPGTSSPTNNNNPDFSSYNPSGNPDYTGLTGKTYYREFTDTTNSVRSNCTLHIQGFTLDDLKNSRIEIWLFIPGRFTSECYVHSTEEFNYSTFDGDNDPMRVNSSTTNTIQVSFGNYGLDSTHNTIQMRLVINDDSIEPSQIVITW